MKILVTGGAGYVGSILVPYLLREGHDVTVLDNFMYNQTSLLDCCGNNRFDVVRGDVRDGALLARYAKKADVIMPLACLTGAPLCKDKPAEAHSIIVESIRELLNLRAKDQIIIYPTTNSGYGIGQRGKFCTEKTPLYPISVYGKLKAEAEKIVLDSGNSITFRLATVFGVSPRMRLDLLVNDFTYRAVNDRFIVLFEPHFKRNYIHIYDVARAFGHAIANFDKMKNAVYNIGLSDSNLSKLELCEEIKKQVPDFYFVEAKVGEDPDKRDYVVSNEKIEQAGFRPEVSLRDGIRELVKCFQIIRKNQYSNV